MQYTINPKIAKDYKHLGKISFAELSSDTDTLTVKALEHPAFAIPGATIAGFYGTFYVPPISFKKNEIAGTIYKFDRAALIAVPDTEVSPPKTPAEIDAGRAVAPENCSRQELNRVHISTKNGKTTYTGCDGCVLIRKTEDTPGVPDGESHKYAPIDSVLPAAGSEAFTLTVSRKTLTAMLKTKATAVRFSPGDAPDVSCVDYDVDIDATKTTVPARYENRDGEAFPIIIPKRNLQKILPAVSGKDITFIVHHAHKMVFLLRSDTETVGLMPWKALNEKDL